ncbi:MAG: class I SAM-dependent methyltransferase [Methylocystis sp.]
MCFNELPREEPPRFDLSNVFHEEDLLCFQRSRIIPETRVYNWYAAYGRVLRPRRLLEIGVRRGYGAYSLIKGARGSVERYLGIDSERDLPGSNVDALAQLRRLGVPDVTLVRADTQKTFPALDGPFDLVHIDGDHSMRGALNDFCHVLPFLTERAAIILDDVESPSVRHAAALIQSAIGDQALFVERGGLHKQMLMRFLTRPPALSLDALVAIAPPQCSTFLLLQEELAKLRAIEPEKAALTDIGRQFSCVLRLAAASVGLSDFSPRPSATDALSIFGEFMFLVEALSELGGAKLGVAIDQLQTEVKLHGAYALERLADVPAPPSFGGVQKRDDAFQPGSENHRLMAFEAACNFSAICERAIESMSNAQLRLRQDA